MPPRNHDVCLGGAAALKRGVFGPRHKAAPIPPLLRPLGGARLRPWSTRQGDRRLQPGSQTLPILPSARCHRLETQQ